MAKTEADKAAENEAKDEANSNAEPNALVGSGAKQLHVHAHVGLFGLSAGTDGYVYDTPETQANLKNGNLSLVDEK